MAPTLTTLLLGLSLLACGSAQSPGGGSDAVVKATSCKGGEMTYLGFRGTGQPPPALVREIRRRFPDAAIIELGDGMLGVVIAEPHSWAVRERHEAAAAAVGWKGDVVDFPSVTRDCQASFHTPQPPTTPPIGGGASSAPNPPAPPPPTSTPPLHQ